MSTEGELNRYRDKAVRLQQEISRYSLMTAVKQKKAATARAAVLKTKSQASIRSKNREAETAVKDANAAESKRADAEKKLAGINKKINQLQSRYEKEQHNNFERSLKAIRKAADAANNQFSGVPKNLMKDTMRTEPPKHYDIFLSHASEDKDEIARPLLHSLEKRGLTVWFDELKIKVGHSIRQDIEEGIANASFGVVILSPNFFSKHWTQAELDALFNKKMDTGESVILPIWHRVTKDEVASHSPLLAGIMALNTATMTIDEIADNILKAVRD